MGTLKSTIFVDLSLQFLQVVNSIFQKLFYNSIETVIKKCFLSPLENTGRKIKKTYSFLSFIKI